jgi:hypothetical protein
MVHWDRLKETCMEEQHLVESRDAMGALFIRPGEPR